MARFRGEPVELPAYLVEGLLVLADETDEQPWPTPGMSKFLRAMASGCAIRDGKKGYFEITTRTFHVGRVSKLLGTLVKDSCKEWWTRNGKPSLLERYWENSDGSTQKRKHVFKFRVVVPLTDGRSLQEQEQLELLSIIEATIKADMPLCDASQPVGDDEQAAPIPWSEGDLEIDIKFTDEGTAYYYRDLNFYEIALTIPKHRVLPRLGFPKHVAD